MRGENPPAAGFTLLVLVVAGGWVAVDEQTVVRAKSLAADETVAPGIRRSVADATDDLERALAVRRLSS